VDLLCLTPEERGADGSAERLHPQGIAERSSPVRPQQGALVRKESIEGDTVRSATHPPSFSDTVKRSTRFITSVPAAVVLDKVESILETMRFQRMATPIGFIGKVVLDWERYSIEVWGLDTQGPALCALHIFRMPVKDAATTNSSSSGLSEELNGRQMYLVEFVRGQLEIFAFKRFYQWVRQRLSELVQQDYSTVFTLEQNISS
jgi:hypothetical protein